MPHAPLPAAGSAPSPAAAAAALDATVTLVQQAAAHGAGLYRSPELVVASAAGCWVTTASCAQLLDFAGGMGVHVLGHQHPRVVAAIVAQAQRLAHTANGLYTEPPIRLMQRLSAWPHGPWQSFFVNSGAEAMEGALKLARAHHARLGRPRARTVACQRGFHGRTMWALSVTGQPKLHAGFAPLMPDTTFVPYDDLPALEAAMGDDVAAVVLEPIQGNGGVRVPAPGYLSGVRALCDAHGALMVLDEVQTGMGRTGALLACADPEHGARPDIVCLAKALGGGLPLGAVLAAPALMAALTVGSHGSTFGGNPVACAAGLAVLDVLEGMDLPTRAAHIFAQLAPQLAALPHVAGVRGRGLLLGVVLTEGRTSARVRAAALADGMLVTEAGPDVVRLFVPAIADDAVLAEGVARLGRALGAA